MQLLVLRVSKASRSHRVPLKFSEQVIFYLSFLKLIRHRDSSRIGKSIQYSMHLPASLRVLTPFSAHHNHDHLWTEIPPPPDPTRPVTAPRTLLVPSGEGGGQRRTAHLSAQRGLPSNWFFLENSMQSRATLRPCRSHAHGGGSSTIEHPSVRTKVEGSCMNTPAFPSGLGLSVVCFHCARVIYDHPHGHALMMVVTTPMQTYSNVK